MKPRFLGDANFHIEIIRGIVRGNPLIDFETADAIGLRGQDDLKVLLIASEADRILVTHDLQTMPAHFGTFLNKMSSPGVILVNQSIDIGRAIEGLTNIWESFEHEEWLNRIAYFNHIHGI